jgi:type IV pilus assembly protein PilN
MIRVNLLPGKREKAGRGGVTVEPGQGWLGIVFAAVLVEVVVLYLFHHSMQTDLTSINAESGRLDSQIAKIKTDTKDHKDVLDQLAALRDREAAINKLQSARTGPTSALLEISRVLSVGRGPTTDRDKLEQLKHENPAAVPNPTWDPRRLWINKYTEVDRTVKIEGLARDGEDVAEFERRLALSDYFYDVKPPSATEKMDDVSHVSLKQFTIVAKVKY